nr:hypothetical protein CFP56_16366 [Quercus suber]
MECEFLALEKIRKEAAELQRSTKKVKEDHSPSSTMANAGGQLRDSLSYKAKLVGELLGAYAQAFEVHYDPEIEAYSDDEKEDLSEGEVAIKLSREMKLHIRGRWAHSPIVKVHGKTVGFQFLHSRIMQLWKPAGRLDCIDLGEDFFLIKFGLIEDYDKENHELSPVNARANPIKPHDDLGLVRIESNGGMVPHFSSNSQDQENGVSTLDRPGLAGVGKPLVEIPNGHPIKGGRKNSGVESAVTKFVRANLAKIKPSEGNTNKENVRKIDLSNKFDGAFGSHHSNPNVWGKHPNQSPNNV